jgi:hypothetical protein
MRTIEGALSNFVPPRGDNLTIHEYSSDIGSDGARYRYIF